LGVVPAKYALTWDNYGMALGRASVQQGFDDPRVLLGDRLREGSLYRLLADHGHPMFPDGYFADLFTESAKGRPTVVATVMLLQAFEGLSDREACDRLEVDLRWQAAAGVDAGCRAFHPTVLVGMRNKLRASACPRRLFEDTKLVARQTGAMRNRARVLDSTPVFDAVATQDTVTQLRASVRSELAALDKAGSPLAAQVRALLGRDDDYATPGKPPCDWDDPAAREMLVDALVKDALAALRVLDGRQLPLPAIEAAGLLALVAGQDVEQGEDGVFRIARKAARDRVISIVDTAARHGHKSRNRRFDGYKAHLSVDPDSELIDEVAATPASAPDRDAASGLPGGHVGAGGKPEVVGDSAYGDAATRADLEAQGFTVTAKCPPARNSGGLASFRPWCATCPLRAACTACTVGAPSPSTPKKRCSSGPAPPSVTRPGSSATAPTGPPSNARSPTSPGGPGAGAKPAPAAWPASPPTCAPAPQPSTGPGSPSSASTTTRPDGHCGPREHPDGGKTTPQHRPTAHWLTAWPSPPASTARPKSQTAARLGAAPTSAPS
jgi:hypothetical protein